MARNRSRWLRIGSNAAFAALWLVFFGGLAGCQRKNQYVAPPPPKVIVATAQREPVTIYHEYTGSTQASAVVQLQARVQGYLQKILFTDGVNVEENQLLFVIDPRPFEAAVEQAKADLQSKQATVTQQESVYKRTLALLPSRAATQEQADIDRGNWLVAKANVVQSEANLRQAELNLEYCQIHAPTSGRIGRHLVDLGNLVTANSTALATITKFDPMYAYFNVSETNYLDFLERQRKGGAQAGGGVANPEHTQATAEGKQPADYPIELGLSDETGYPHKGTINFLDNTVDPNSGTILVRGVFKNPPPYYLAPGLFVRVRVPVRKEPQSLVVPDEAIATDQAGPYLLVVRSDNSVERRDVKPGELVGDKRVIEKGIKPAERFVVEGLQRARPGEKVAPEQAPAAQMAAKTAATAAK
jgi:membrane fusion protein, multidrug efflux system